MSKVARIIDEYGVTGIGEEMARRWTAEGSERQSLRTLADYFNETLLATRLREEDITTLDGEAANYYRLLRSDDVSSGTRVQAENRLEQGGIDVAKLRSDFVSRQAVHTYLTNERDETYDRPDTSDEERIDTRIETVGRLKNRLVSVTEQAISELVQTNRLSSEDARVTVLVQAHCTHCGTQYPITEYFTNGGCSCRSSDLESQ